MISTRPHRLWLLSACFVALLLLASCGGQERPSGPPVGVAPATATAQPEAAAGGVAAQPAAPAVSPQPTARGGIPTPPDRDLYELVQRLRLRSAVPIQRVVNPEPVTLAAGHKKTFQLIDLRTNDPFTVEATLQLVTENAYFFVEDGARVSQGDLEKAAQEFERKIYPTVTGLFGQEWRPGVDNDPRLYLVHARIPLVAGYYSASDEYPRVVNRLSNECECTYINIQFLRPGTSEYLNTLAHELQHAVHWNADRTEEVWVNEGLSELAVELAGFRAGLVEAFLPRPDVQLTAWPDKPERTPPHYGAAFMFFRYLAFHYGGFDRLKALVQEPLDGIEGVNAYLAKAGFDKDFDGVFKDWVVANYLNVTGGGPYSQPDQRYRVRGAEALGPGQRESTVNQHAADYYEVKADGRATTIAFEGAMEVPILPTTVPGGRRFWWSNRGDAIDATMTRRFDLSGLSRATLNFKTWYDIEKDFDFAYVMASRDDGKSWDILKGRFTSPENKLDNSYGEAYTGRSGGGDTPRWVEESVDLTPYVGGPILLRFEYITDDAVNNDGWAIDDIAIPELGFSDSAEGDGPWELRGFVATENVLPQRFAVQLIEAGERTVVRDVPLDAQNRGTVTVPATVRQATLVVAATTQHTVQPASYKVRVTQEPRP